jgi:hypothetical protein
MKQLPLLRLIDIVATRLQVLERNNATNFAIQSTIEAGFLLVEAGEKREDENEEIQFEGPDRNTIVDFLEVTIQMMTDAKDLAATKAINEESGWVKFLYNSSAVALLKSKAMINEYYRVIKKDRDAEAEFEAFKSKAANAVVIINEEIKPAKLLESMLRYLWTNDFHDKQVYMPENLKPTISGFMDVSPENVHFDSVACDDCIKKFNLEETIFYTLGFKAGEKLPVEFPKEAFVVQV